MNDFAEPWVITKELVKVPVRPGYLLKRPFDLMVASLLLVLLLPVMLAIALMVRLDSAGPILFRQERVGAGGRRFTLYKFRTMVVNAEALKHTLEGLNEAQGPLFKMKNDPRMTRVGAFLRRTSLDELPQLVNVLKGDMSMIGPRPPIPQEVECYERWHLRRLAARPGITGLWQVNGRSNLSFDQGVHYDLDYVERCSFWLDLSILFKTLWVVYKGVGAY